MKDLTIFGHIDDDLEQIVQLLKKNNVGVVIRDERELNRVLISEAKERAIVTAISKCKGKEIATSSDKGTILKENEMSQRLSIRIDKMFSSSPSISNLETYIFRVDELLHKENKKAYEPELLAIGPYYYHNYQLKMMERHKRRYLQEVLEQKNESNVDKYVKAMEPLEEKARNCYAEWVNLTVEDFVDMMVLDGIFIVELLRKYTSPDMRGTDILLSDRIQSILIRDLLLYENQLPLFVLTRLLEVADEPNFSVESALKDLLNERKDFQLGCSDSPVPEEGSRHLLGIMRSTMLPSFPDELGPSPKSYPKTRCATELLEAGIKFDGDIGRASFMDIQFQEGIMTIPRLFISDDTDILFRNMMAYEQYNRANERAYVTNYLKFLSGLIKSPKDVKILRQCGSIFSMTTDDQVIFSMFKKLFNYAILPFDGLHYLKLWFQVDEHCRRHRTRWMAKWRHNRAIWIAKLMQDYFNSPWSVISLIGVIVLLVLTVIQTVCSILQV